MDVSFLVDTLADVPPAQLQAFALMQQAVEPGRFFPTGIERGVMIEATQELMAYAKSCAELAERIMKTSTAIAAPFVIDEFGL